MTTISASSNEPDLSIRWPALVKFFRLPWFSRVWVLQEVVMAREARAFFCGHEVLWTHLRKATSLMFASPFTHLSRGAASGLRSVAMIDKWRSWKVEKPPVALPIMVETRSKEATMAIDKFLGVLALLDLDYPANAVGYRTPVEEVLSPYRTQGDRGRWASVQSAFMCSCHP